MNMLNSLKALLFATPTGKGVKTAAGPTGGTGDFAQVLNNVGTVSAGQRANLPAAMGVTDFAAPAAPADDRSIDGQAAPLTAQLRAPDAHRAPVIIQAMAAKTLPVASDSLVVNTIEGTLPATEADMEQAAPVATQALATSVRSEKLTQAAPAKPSLVVASDRPVVDTVETAPPAPEADVGQTVPMTALVQAASVSTETLTPATPVHQTDPAPVRGNGPVPRAPMPADDHRAMPQSSGSLSPGAAIAQIEVASPSAVPSASVPQDVAMTVMTPPAAPASDAGETASTTGARARAEPPTSHMASRSASRPAGSNDLPVHSRADPSTDMEPDDSRKARASSNRDDDISPAIRDAVSDVAPSVEPIVPPSLPVAPPLIVTGSETAGPVTFGTAFDPGMTAITVAPVAAGRSVAVDLAAPAPVATTNGTPRNIPVTSTTVAPDLGDRPQVVATVPVATVPVATVPVATVPVATVRTADATAAPARVATDDGVHPVAAAADTAKTDRTDDGLHRPTPAIAVAPAPVVAPVSPTVAMVPSPVSDAAAPAAMPQNRQPMPLQAADMPQVADPAGIATPRRAEAVSLLQLVRDHMNVRAPREMEVAASLPSHVRDAGTDAPVAAIPVAMNDSAPSLPPSVQTIASSPAAATAALPTVDLSASLGAQMIDMGVSGQWIDGLARDIAGLSAHGAQGRFRINAEQLGPVQVDIRQGDDGAAISLTVMTEAAERALRQDSDLLKQDMAAASVRFGDVKIERAPPVAETARADTAQTTSQQQPGGQQGQNPGQAAGQGMGQSSAQSHMQGRGQPRENIPLGHKAGSDAAVLNHTDGGAGAGGAVRARYA